VGVDERGDRIRRNTEGLVCDVGGFLRRRNHPHPATSLFGGFDGGGEHGRLPASRRALHDDEGIARGDRLGGCGLPSIEAGGLRQLVHVRQRGLIYR
jgi:hypothetical protein